MIRFSLFLVSLAVFSYVYGSIGYLRRGEFELSGEDAIFLMLLAFYARMFW